MRENIILRKIAGVFAACRRGHGMQMLAAPNAAPLSSLAFGLCLLLLPVMIVLAALVALTGPDVGGLILATAPALAIPRKSRADLDSIIKNAEKIEGEWQGKQMPDDVATQYNALMAEGASLSEAINTEAKNAQTMKRMRATSEFLREVPDVTLPAMQAKDEDGEVAGYITPGHLAVLSDQYAKCIKADGTWRKGSTASIELKGGLLPVSRARSTNGHALIALSTQEVKSLRDTVLQIKQQDGFERKDLPIFGDLVIAPARVDRFVQDTRPDVLTLRDVLTVIPTSAALIQYVAELSYDPGAAIQSEGTTAATTATKGEADVEYELRDAPIRTIADTIPVSEQQLSDAPALISRINNRLLWGVRRKEEQLMGYGTGSGLEFAGFFDSDSDVVAATTSGTTLIDKIREAQTEIMVDGYQPGFVWIHPEDWEGIELTKGSDGHYVWAIIRDVLGPRIWSMRVVQGVGTKKVGANTRNVLVGDQMGAAIYDREQANIAIGWIDDQFAKNLRTIRAEERMTLTIDAPKAFRKINTVA